jgi:pimeloyl-ACP methyl ester carboxylesterase
MIRRRWAKLLAAVLLLLAFFFGVVVFRSVRYAERTLRPPRESIAPEVRSEAAAALPGLSDVALRTSDGLRLGAWYAPGRNGAAVVLVHGWGRNRATMVPEAAELVRRGCAVLLYDARAHGESDGDLCTWGDREPADMAAAVDYLAAQPGVRAVGALGFSLGATVVAEEAAHDPRVRAVVVEAGQPTIRAGFAFDLQRYGWVGVKSAMLTYEHHGIRAEDVSMTAAMTALAPRPSLVVAGGEDPFSPMYMNQEIFDAARAPRELYVVAGAKHGEYMKVPAGTAYLARIGRFFQEALLE